MNLSHKYYRSLVLTYSLRLIGTLGLYLCFGVISQNVYAVLDSNKPLETTHGSLWLLQDDGSYTETIQLETEVDIDVSSIIARTTVRQRFRNNSNNWTEGLYTFPLPENAAIDTFSLHIGDRVIQGQVQERQQARESYNRAKQQGVRSSLVEQQRPNLFKTSLANIGPGEEITILIEYQQTLDYKDGTYRLRFPMVAGPRFHASGSISSHDDDTDISIRVTESGNVNPIYIHVLLDAGVPLEKINSSYHDIDIRQTSEHRYSIALNTPYYADRDFELTWTPELGSTPEASIFTQTRGDYDYALVTLMPPALHALGQQITPRDIIFILDVSGSMSGTSIQQAKASLIQSIKRLDPEDRFNIIWFNDKSERLFPDVTHATDEALAIAARVTDGLDADGGTVMLPALMLALEQKTESERLRQIVFLTDGNVDNEKQLFSVIRNRLGNSRLFTIGIGSAPNSYFMRKAARAGRGTFTHIGDINEVQYKTEQLLKKLESPALTNIHAFSNETDIEIFPQPLPDLYLGEPVTLLLRGKTLGDHVSLNGDYGDSLWQQTVDLTTSNRHAGIHTAWAREKLAVLMETEHETIDETARTKIKHEIIDLSIDHHLVSRYTSLVAIDTTPVNNSGELATHKLKTNLPHGWQKRQNNPQNPQILVAGLSLPQTATTAGLHILNGLLLTVIALSLYMWRRQHDQKS